MLLSVFFAFGGDTHKARPIFILDGDTFICTPDSEIIRLWGIDAPELDQPFGKVALAFMIEFAHKKQVTVEKKGESYKRTVGKITIGDKDLGLELLKNGLAHYVPKFAPNQTDYAEAEAFAKRHRIGLWGQKQVIIPEDWRKARKITDTEN